MGIASQAARQAQRQRILSCRQGNPSSFKRLCQAAPSQGLSRQAMFLLSERASSSELEMLNSESWGNFVGIIQDAGDIQLKEVVHVNSMGGVNCRFPYLEDIFNQLKSDILQLNKEIQALKAKEVTP